MTPWLEKSFYQGTVCQRLECFAHAALLLTIHFIVKSYNIPLGDVWFMWFPIRLFLAHSLLTLSAGHHLNVRYSKHITKALE